MNDLIDYINNIHPKTQELFNIDPTCSLKEVINAEINQMVYTIDCISKYSSNIKNIPLRILSTNNMSISKSLHYEREDTQSLN